MPVLSIIARAAVLATVLIFSGAAAEAKDKSAAWTGAYGYEDGRPAVFFSLKLTQNGTTINGHITEVQTFGSQTSDNALRANVAGSVNGHVVSFTKTYDGSGGQSHSVRYSGTLIVDGANKFMFGTWRIGGDVGSWFATVDE